MPARKPRRIAPRADRQILAAIEAVEAWAARGAASSVQIDVRWQRIFRLVSQRAASRPTADDAFLIPLA